MKLLDRQKAVPLEKRLQLKNSNQKHAAGKRRARYRKLEILLAEHQARPEDAKALARLLAIKQVPLYGKL